MKTEQPTSPDNTDASLRNLVEDLAERVNRLEDEKDELEETVNELEKDNKILKTRVDGVDATADKLTSATAEMQSRELEKGAHFQYKNVEPWTDELDVAEGGVERITKDDGETYARLPGEDDPLNRGGEVAHSTADLLPIQRLSRYDDDMLASVTNRKPDELAAKAWRERDDAGRYDLWTNGSKGWRVYLKSSDLADWIRSREDGVSKNWSQELARRTMDAMKELSKHRLVKQRKSRTADGLKYKENVLVLKEDTDLPGEVSPGTSDDEPATGEVAG